MVIISVIGFAVSSGHLLWTRSYVDAQQRARLCAAGLNITSHESFEVSARRLLNASKRIVAVGQFNQSGQLQHFFPDLAPFQKAASTVMAQSSTTMMVKLDEAGVRGNYWGTIIEAPVETPGTSGVPNGLDVSDTPDAPNGADALDGPDVSPTSPHRFLVISTHDSFGKTWIQTILMYSLCTGITAIAVGSWMACWFNRRITKPLGALSELIQNQNGGPFTQQVSPRSNPTLLQGVAGEFAEIIRHWAQVEARVLKSEQSEQQAERRLRDQESGLSRQLRRAEDLATRDALTCLRNRAFLERELEAMVEQHRINGHELAVVMIDMDNFKKHNDTFGHKAGDELLRFVGDLLKGSIRPEDHAVRYGGDEFLLLLSNVEKQQAIDIAQRTIQIFRQYASSIMTATPLSLSAGVTMLSEHPGKNGHQLVDRADVALYASKRAGKNTVAAA